MLKSRRIRHKSAGPLPLCEMLEGRLLLAATPNVVATLTNGVLVVTGGDGAETFVLEAGGLAGTIKITGTSTTINGAASWTTPSVVTGAIKITTGAGDNHITVQYLTAPKTLSMTKTGSGNAWATVESCTIKGDTTITGGLQYQNVALTDSCVFEGNVVVDGTATPLNGVAAYASQFKKSLTVKNSGLKSCNVTLRDCQVSGNVSLPLGNSDNDLTIEKSSGTSSIGGDLIYTGGSTVDTVTVTNTTITGQAKFELGGEDDVFLMASSTVKKALTINAGEGANQVTVNAATTIEGATTVTAGDGDDKFTFGPAYFKGAVTINGRGGSPNVGNKLVATSCDFGKTLTIQGSEGLDTMTFTGCNVVGALATALGDGGSSFTFQKGSASCTIGGDFSYKAGQGDDSVKVSDTTIAGQAKTDTGLGAGSTGHTITITNAVLKKNLQCTSLSGDGTIALTGSTVQGNVATSAAKGWAEDLRVLGTSVVDGSVSMASANGLDVLTLDFGSQIEGNVGITGFGGASLRMSPGSSTPCEIKGDATLTSKTGIAITSLNAGTIDGKLAITGGANGCSVSIPGAVTIKKDFSLTVTGGQSMITLAGATFSGKTSIKTGPGQDTLVVDDATFTGKATFDMGAGYDIVNMERASTTAGLKTTVTAGLDLLGGAGNDTITLGWAGDAKRQVVFSAASNLDGGPDSDKCTNNNITGTLVLKNFE